MHRPFVTCGDTAQNDAARRAYASVFSQTGVRFVIQAHMHGYERFDIDGVTYVTTGGGGGLLGNTDQNVSRTECGARKAAGAFFHALDVTVRGAAMVASAIDENGIVRDSVTIALP